MKKIFKSFSIIIFAFTLIGAITLGIKLGNLVTDEFGDNLLKISYKDLVDNYTRMNFTWNQDLSAFTYNSEPLKVVYEFKYEDRKIRYWGNRLNGKIGAKLVEITFDINPIYLKNIKEIDYFDAEFLRGFGANGKGIQFIGQYQPRNDRILVRYAVDELSMRAVICHELLHSFMSLDEETHKVVEDIGYQVVCFR